MSRLFIWNFWLAACWPAMAGEADILDVEVTCNSESVCRFDVTVTHDDQGWEHYASRWEVLSPDGTIIAIRELAHPHDDEQPFTRSLSGIAIPGDVDAVVVRAHDLIHEYGGEEITVKISR